MIININTSKFNINIQPSFKSEKKLESNNKLERTPSKDKFELSVGYINDLHGQTGSMMKLLSALKGDLRLSGGDNTIGDEKNKLINKSVIKFMNIANIKASALGNHEMDTTENDFIELMADYNGDILAANLRKIKSKDEKHDFDGMIKKSTVVTIKGEKIGLIGGTPLDFMKRITHPKYHEDCKIDNLEDTIDNIQDEIDELEQNGINKIFLLSHMGNDVDKKLAQKLEGVDVIIGGHTHELINDIKEGDNLFYSEKGTPVIITEAGKNGKNFGLLNLVFDSNGVIIKAQNNIGSTDDFHKNMINQTIFDKILGKAEIIGQIKDIVEPPKTLIEENAHANFACDAMKNELNTDIAIWNNSGTRNFFKPGIIDSRDIKDIAPFEDRVSVADVSEDKIVNMFKKAIEKTYSTQGNKPGLLAVSGLKYTVNSSSKKLESMSFIDKNNNEINIDINNPNKNKIYKVAQDSFMMYEGADYESLASKEECINYSFNKDFLICQYIKHLNKPISINQTGRLNVVS